MTNFEMEPAFCKALKLLQSSAKESTEEIMHLLEEVISQKYGGTKSLNLKSGTFFEENSKSSEVQKSAKVSRSSSPVQAVSGGQSTGKSSRDSSPPSEPVSSRTSPDVDDDLALEIFEDDLNCKICKGMTVGPRNRLVECSDCHMLYHQECHKPPILENVNDPRLVWYCSSCSKKNQEKVQTKIKSTHVESAHKKSKCELQSENKNPAFKRNEKSSNNHSNKTTSSGMVHLAASLQGSKSSSSSSSSSSSTSSSKHHSNSNTSSKSSGLNYSKTPSSPNPKSQSGPASAPANIIAADKRLQNMKKKAAAKMQEKRSKHK